MYSLPQSFTFRRDLPEGVYKLTDIFRGLKEAPELINVFGDDLQKIQDIAVTLTNKSKHGGKLEYAYIHDGGIHFGADYIKAGPENYIYLDIIHELAHIKQLWDGKDLWDKEFAYVDMPTEIEAYRASAAAARRIGMKREEISEYLKVPWATDEEMKRLEKTLGV